NITLAEIAARIEAEVDTDPAGEISGANLRVRTGAAARTPEDIAALVIRTNDDGSRLRIGDVATVVRDSLQQSESYFVAGMPAVNLSVNRSAQGDAIAIQRKVEEIIAKFQATLPPGVSIDLVRTRVERISARLDILLDNAAVGLALVLGLLFLFLNARTALWVAAGIPVAMLTALAILYAAGGTLNLISLFGLIITLGIIVDDAIVVAEHADYRARHLGEAPVQAAERAAKRMALPVFAATATTAVAFSGLFAIDGWYGAFVRDIPITVIAVLAASLVECFLILPNHMAHALAGEAKERWYDWPSRKVNNGFRWVREELFRPFIAGVIAARYAVVAAVIALLASQISLFIQGDVKWRFFSAPERNMINGNFVMVEGASRVDSLEMMHEMQRATDAVAAEYEAEHGKNPIKFVYSQVGDDVGRGLPNGDGKDAELLGGIRIELIDSDERDFTTFAFLADLQSRVERHPLAEAVSFSGSRAGRNEGSLSIQLSGAEADILKEASLTLQDILSRYPEVSALNDDLFYDKEEVILTLTPQGDAMGFVIEDLNRVLRNRLDGIEAASFPEGLRSAEIHVALPETELTADFLNRTLMRSPEGVYVPLSDIVHVERRTGFRSVQRVNGVGVLNVAGDVSEDDPARASEIERVLRQTILPEIEGSYQLNWKMAGLAEEESTFLTGALTGYIACLIAIYSVLAWVFSSWSRPVIVLAIVPFGLIGTIYGHAVWNMPLSMFTVVGLLGMTGIIINDSIVLVTTIDRYAAKRGLIPSIIDGAVDRLRPVILTTLTTVLGMMPLLFETSRQAQFLKPTVITLVYGLAFGMVLVLMIVPALLAIQEDIRRSLLAARRAVGFRRKPVQKAAAGLAVLIGIWAIFTLGWAVMQGALAPPLSAILPPLWVDAVMPTALVAFVLGAAILCVTAYLALTTLVLRKKPEA
ncbi:MAG: efflux RND transporter permease subunit, partial [Pseudomonadota bacterium]